jgi:hypothetical protein
MQADQPKKVLNFPKIDYSDLHKFVADEKLNGSLVGDPAWDDWKTNKIKEQKDKFWIDRLQKSLDELSRVFSE